MKKIIFSAGLVLIISAVFSQPKVQLNDKFVLVIHGGAGTILKSQMTPEKEPQMK